MPTVTFSEQWRRLLEARNKLDRTTSVSQIIEIVRLSARSITGAQGITFVRREGDRCRYVAEDAISPLWLGRDFPMSSCISGWCMLNKQSAVIDDVYIDDRIPSDAYRPTFVASLAMVPIGVPVPVASLGAYWATKSGPARESLYFLHGLAGSVGKALQRHSYKSDVLASSGGDQLGRRAEQS